MQAAVNAIKTHMIRSGVKRIPGGPFPHYQQYLDDVKREASNPNNHHQDSKPYGNNITMSYHHSRPNSVSPRLEYGRSSRSPPAQTRSPLQHHHNNHNHRSSDPEDHHSHHHHPLTSSNNYHQQHSSTPPLEQPRQQGGSIILEHSSYRHTNNTTEHCDSPPPSSTHSPSSSHRHHMVVHPKESTYYRGGVGEVGKRDLNNGDVFIKRENGVGNEFMKHRGESQQYDRKRRHSDHDRHNEIDDEMERRYRYTEPAGVHHRSHPAHCAHKMARRNSSSGYPPSSHRNHHHIKRHDSPPPPDSRLSLYEENARKFAEERLKVLDRFHFGRETAGLFRRHGAGSPGPFERREPAPGAGSTKHRDHHRDSPPPPPPPSRQQRGYDNNRSPVTNGYERDERSSPNNPYHRRTTAGGEGRTYEKNNESHRRSPEARDSMYRSTPAIVLGTTNYLPTAAGQKTSLSPTTSSKQQKSEDKEKRNEVEEPVSYMYRRYSPMISVSTQTESFNTSKSTTETMLPDTTAEATAGLSLSGPFSRPGEEEANCAIDSSTADLSIVKKETLEFEEHRDISSRSPTTEIDDEEGLRKEWKGRKIPSPINTKACENIERHGAFEFHNGGSDDKDHHHHHHHHLGNPGHCKCGCMETIESPSGTGTVVVYPKEVV